MLLRRVPPFKSIPRPPEPVLIQALMANKEKAVAALRFAIDNGFRSGLVAVPPRPASIPSATILGS
jgi:hypothetical protein